MNFNQVSVFMTLSEVHMHLVEWQNIYLKKKKNLLLAWILKICDRLCVSLTSTLAVNSFNQRATNTVKVKLFVVIHAICVPPSFQLLSSLFGDSRLFQETLSGNLPIPVSSIHLH